MDAMSPWGLKSCIEIRVRAYAADFVFFFPLYAMRATLTRQKGLRSMDSNVNAGRVNTDVRD